MQSRLDHLAQSTLVRLAHEQQIDLLPVMRTFTFDALAQAIFGDALSPDRKAALGADFGQIYAFFSRVVKYPQLLRWYRLIGREAAILAKAQAIKADAVALVHQKRLHGAADDATPDIITLLLGTKYEDSGEGMDDTLIAEECLTLLVAGHETCSNALTWVTYLLAKHPDIYQRLRTDLQSTEPSGYLQQVIDETLRLYPPSWTTDRLAQADDQVSGFLFPQGARIILFMFGLHHNPEHWPDPERFDPDRFAEAEKAKRHTYAYLPFGAGARMCIGRNLALMIIQTYTTAMARQMDLQLVTQQVGLKPAITLQPDVAIIMQYKLLQDGHCRQAIV
jgi:cytochrome P450